jgi:hypothetical protein
MPKTPTQTVVVENPPTLDEQGNEVKQGGGMVRMLQCVAKVWPCIAFNRNPEAELPAKYSLSVLKQLCTSCGKAAGPPWVTPLVAAEED